MEIVAQLSRPVTSFITIVLANPFTQVFGVFGDWGKEGKYGLQNLDYFIVLAVFYWQGGFPISKQNILLPTREPVPELTKIRLSRSISKLPQRDAANLKNENECFPPRKWWRALVREANLRGCLENRRVTANLSALETHENAN